jgi:hypothetical protein
VRTAPETKTGVDTLLIGALPLSVRGWNHPGRTVCECAVVVRLYVVRSRYFGAGVVVSVLRTNGEALHVGV